MSKGFLVTFVAVAAVAAVGVDYLNQTKAAGLQLGQLTLSGYASTITGRYTDYHQGLEDQARRSALLRQARRELLPAAPEGWTRHGWGDADETDFGMDQDIAMPEELKTDKTLQSLLALDRAAARSKREDQSYVYEKDGNRIALLMYYDSSAGQGSGMAGPFVSLVNNNIEAMSGKTGFAVVQGVTFRRDLGMMNFGMTDDGDVDPSRTIRNFSANLNDQIHVSVMAKAEDEAIFELLSAIDFDTLNFLLDQPIAGIGGATPVIPWDQQKATADARVADDSAAQLAVAAEQNRKLMEWAEEMRERHKGKTPSQEEYLGGVGQMVTMDDNGGQDAGGGFLSTLGGFFGKEEEAPAPDAKAPLPTGFGGNCSITNGVKRCTVGN